MLCVLNMQGAPPSRRTTSWTRSMRPQPEPASEACPASRGESVASTPDHGLENVGRIFQKHLPRESEKIVRPAKVSDTAAVPAFEQSVRVAPTWRAVTFDQDNVTPFPREAESYSKTRRPTAERGHVRPMRRARHAATSCAALEPRQPLPPRHLWSSWREARRDPWRGLCGPGTGDATLRVPRGRSPRDAHRPERLFQLRVLEA
jgi:hypothetical protein